MFTRERSVEVKLGRVGQREEVREGVRLKRSLLRRCRTPMRGSLLREEEVAVVVGRGKVSLNLGHHKLFELIKIGSRRESLILFTSLVSSYRLFVLSTCCHYSHVAHSQPGTREESKCSSQKAVQQIDPLPLPQTTSKYFD